MTWKTITSSTRTSGKLLLFDTSSLWKTICFSSLKYVGRLQYLRQCECVPVMAYQHKEGLIRGAQLKRSYLYHF